MEFRPLGPIGHARLAGSLLSWNFIMGECLCYIVSMGLCNFSSLRRTIEPASNGVVSGLIIRPCFATNIKIS